MNLKRKNKNMTTVWIWHRPSFVIELIPIQIFVFLIFIFFLLSLLVVLPYRVKQKAIMQGGEYLLSLGCTVFRGEELAINHRLYDVTYLTVLSEINTIGYFDIGTKASITCAKEEQT